MDLPHGQAAWPALCLLGLRMPQGKQLTIYSRHVGCGPFSTRSLTFTFCKLSHIAHYHELGFSGMASNLMLLFTGLPVPAAAFMTSLDGQFAPSNVADSPPSSTAPAGTVTTSSALSSEVSAYTSTSYTSDPFTDTFAQSLSTNPAPTLAPTSFYPCTLYHVPNAPGQPGLNNICECDGSTFDLSFATSGSSSIWCGYTEKPTSTLPVPVPTTTHINSPAATPEGAGRIDVFKFDWCDANNGSLCTYGATPRLGFIRHDDFSCEFLVSNNGASQFLLDAEGAPTNVLKNQTSQLELGFGIVNAKGYCDLSDLLFTNQDDGSVHFAALR